ncbi:nuclear pore complex protein NUP1-like isoform X3 [Benincasa hispida]|uniref:nuclear pore complex protein NUP1-like isoform X3 n=1 Tax=Benincasa hispida TaxID=102211 RepID=UPI00190187A0|nr:nuclear pore complex protein NUP1-like isoform X3 [Benincasa hispida]
MATEREEVRYEGGRGGKFQKRPIRRSHTTPYDRPPTALRNSAGKGWLSKLVDPAQKLITSSAHRLFSSVFRKRLPPPPPSLPLSREANDEMENRNQEEVAADPPVTQEGTNVDFVPSINSNNTHGVSDLEKILKEKTFTRFEIDRLTELLKSRVADVPSGVESGKLEQVPSTPVISYGKQEGCPKFPAQSQDGVSPHMVSTHVVLDEDVASPAEIAKAYMGSRPPKATPLSMASHSQKFGDGFSLGNPSKSPTLSLMPRSPGNFDVENGFVTPRSRGRSALYSMARMPYSRVRATPSIKNSVATTDAYRATSSSSQSAWGQGRLLGSEQGALKRRNSVLDDEMGSVGPIRRIRHKSNHLFPKGLSLPSSSTSIPVSGIGSETSQHLQSTKVHPFSSTGGKGLYSSETKRNLSKMSAESENDMIPSSSFPQIPLRSSEMASKILEQLDKLTPPKEKSSELKLLSVRNNSPSKLSPSMLHGPALRSLEDVDSAKYLENVEGIRSNDACDLTSKKNDKFEESSPLKFKVPNDKSISTGNGVGSSVPKETVSGSGQQVSFVGPSLQTKCAFQMSAHEDFVDMDEEGYSNGPVADISIERQEKVNSLVAVSKPNNTEAITVDKPQASIEAKPPTVSAMNKINDQGKSDVPVTTEKSPIFSFPTTSSPSITANVIGPESNMRPEKIASSEVPKAATTPIFGFGEKFPSQKEAVSFAPTFAFVNKITTSTNEQNAIPVVTSEGNVQPTQQASAPTTFKFGDKATFPIPANAATENGNKNEGSPLFASPLVNEKEGAKEGGSASVFKAESSSSSFNCSIPSFGVPKESMSEKAGDKSSSAGFAVGTSGSLFSSSVSTSISTPTSGLFSFSSPSTNSNLNNGSLVSTTPSFPTPATTFSNNITNQNSSIKPSFNAAASNSEPVTTTSLPTSSLMPSFSAAPISKFGSSSVPSTSAPALSAPSGVGSIESKTKQETTFGNLSGIPPSDLSAVKVSSTGSSVFQFGAASTPSDSNKRPANSTFTPSNVPTFGASFSPVSSGLASSTQSTPVLQFNSSSTSFGLTGNTGLASGSSLFGSSAPASNLFASGPTFGLASSSSSVNNSVSSSAGTSSSFFNWQPSSTPSFSTGFSSTPTGGFSFGLSSSSAASNSAPVLFGSSSTGSLTPSMFSFTSAATATTSQPAFGNSNHGFTFGSTPPANNDQANMEDSMAEDTVQTVTSPMPSFGQQPLTPPPSSGFVFGSTAPPLGASPFQFGGSQQNVPTPQNNPSPFQASGSLDFNASAGGSFSLGAGGGDKSNRKFVKVKSKSRKKP